MGPSSPRSALEWALAYRFDLNWNVLPLEYPVGIATCSCARGLACPTPAKHPLIARLPEGRWQPYQERLATEAEIRNWWPRVPTPCDPNLGVITGQISGIATLDVDDRNGGNTSILALDDGGLWLPDDGPVVLSGSRESLHYYLTPRRPMQKSVPFPGVELQADHVLIVAPPSIHAKTWRRYRWLRSPFQYALPPIPDWLEAAALEVAPRERGAATPPLLSAWEDDVVAACVAAGLYLRPHRHRGWHWITCPWAAEHSVPHDDEAKMFEPGTTPAAGWSFRCHHSHCADRHVGELLDYLGIPRRAA
jgi:Bifunctional DNA primase/polymerase, N-terminal